MQNLVTKISDIVDLNGVSAIQTTVIRIPSHNKLTIKFQSKI